MDRDIGRISLVLSCNQRDYNNLFQEKDNAIMPL